MRIVLDTNILISAFIFPGGPPESVYRMALEGRVDLVTSPPLLAEFGRVLTEKFGRDPRAVEEAVAQVAAIGTIVRPKSRLSIIEEDPDDNRVLEAAAAGEVDIIVSGDRHLRKLRVWQSIRILDPASFLQEAT